MGLVKRRIGDYIELLTDYHANGAYKNLKANVELLDEPNYAVMIRTHNFEQGDFEDDLKYIDEHTTKDYLMRKILSGEITV